MNLVNHCLSGCKSWRGRRGKGGGGHLHYCRGSSCSHRRWAWTCYSRHHTRGGGANGTRRACSNDSLRSLCWSCCSPCWWSHLFGNRWRNRGFYRCCGGTSGGRPHTCGLLLASPAFVKLGTETLAVFMEAVACWSCRWLQYQTHNKNNYEIKGNFKD